MKIISANRSDVFNEYISIISRYNDKNLIKEASLSPILRDVTDAGLRGGAHIGESVAKATARTIQITAEEFAVAGVRDLGHIKSIWSKTEQIASKFSNPLEGFLIKDSSGWRLPSDAEIAAVNAIRKNPTDTLKIVDLQKTGFPTLQNVNAIRNITGSDTTNGIFDAAKLLDDGTSFANPSEISNFKILSKRISDASEAPLRRGDIPADIARQSDLGDLARRTDLSDLARRTDVDRAAGAVTQNIGRKFEGVGRGIAKTIAEGRAARKAIMESIQELNSNLLRAIREGSDALAERLTRQIDESFERFDDLLKSEVQAMKESNERLLTEAKDQLAEAIRTGDDRVISELTSKIAEIETKMTGDLASIKSSLDTVNSTMRANAEASAQASAELSSKLGAQADQLTDLKKNIDELKGQLENLKANGGAARGAVDAASTGGTTVAKAGKLKQAYKYLVGALQIAAALGVGYLAYKWYTGLGGSEEDGGGQGRGNDESPLSQGGGGNEEIAIDGEGGGGKKSLAPYLEDPNKRKELFDKIDRMDPERAKELLMRIAKYYDASGYIKLENPVIVEGEEIRYVFPRAFRGGRDPVTDVARRAVTEKYFTKVFTEDTANSRRMISRFTTYVGSSDSQKIANYGFAAIAGGGLFSGKGTFLGLGDRGKRYGKGKENKGVADFGIAGTSQRKMTREERKAVEEMSAISEANDYLSDNTDDPMAAFASGHNEYFNKISQNVNISTNKTNSYEFAKKADKVSNRYFKDAVEDLQDDEFMKAYYAGFSKLHNQKTKKQKPDYEKLYDLHDETGAELIHKAHPKAISVAEAIGNGGLVENGSERSKAMEDIAFRVPSGNYRARYAFIQEALKKKS